MKRWPEIRNEIELYQIKTTNHEVMWREPCPVPEPRRSMQHEYFFSWGRIQSDDHLNGHLLGLFRKNPNRKVDLRDPRAFMLTHTSNATIDDLVVAFHTHLEEKEMGVVAEEIRVIKAINTTNQFLEKNQEIEALEFNFALNREIERLFLLAVQMVSANQLLNANIELIRLDNLQQ